MPEQYRSMCGAPLPAMCRSSDSLPLGIAVRGYRQLNPSALRWCPRCLLGVFEGVCDFKKPHPVHEFQWHLSAVLTALLRAGLRIEQFREYPYSNGARLCENMREESGRRMYPPANLPSLPLMFGLTAVKR